MNAPRPFRDARAVWGLGPALLPQTDSPSPLTFEQFVATSSAHVPIVQFLVNLLLTAVLAMVLAQAYVRYGKTLSNRRLFARNFLLLSLTVMLIITIVKSSLALSLGLVGALSIVRYRAAIKEPEELAYLFLAISIGLGMGANQAALTIVAFAVIVTIVWLRGRLKERHEQPNLHLTLASERPEGTSLRMLVETLEKHCASVDLKRFDESRTGIEAAFLVRFRDFEALEAGRAELRRLDGTLTISLLDNSGLL